MSVKSVLSIAAVAAGLSFGAPVAGAEDAAKTLTPFKAASFHIGGKQALAYYEAGRKACQVTVVVGDKFDDAKSDYAEAVRFTTSVGMGKSARVDTAGASLAMTCAPGAATLHVNQVERVTYVAPINGRSDAHRPQ